MVCKTITDFVGVREIPISLIRQRVVKAVAYDAELDRLESMLL